MDLVRGQRPIAAVDLRVLTGFRSVDSAVRIDGRFHFGAGQNLDGIRGQLVHAHGAARQNALDVAGIGRHFRLHPV